jgi:hypothetical protein
MAAFSSLDQIKVGMKVRCIHIGPDIFGKEGTVVQLNPGIKVEWDDGATHSIYWAYADSFEPVDSLMKISPIIYQDYAYQKVRQEKPCQVCGKPNDLGVSSCWLCGNVPFSDLELNQHMKYIEEFVADSQYTMDEYTDLFLDREDSSHTLTYTVPDLTRVKKDLP